MLTDTNKYRDKNGEKRLRVVSFVSPREVGRRKPAVRENRTDSNYTSSSTRGEKQKQDNGRRLENVQARCERQRVQRNVLAVLDRHGCFSERQRLAEERRHPQGVLRSRPGRLGQDRARKGLLLAHGAARKADPVRAGRLGCT